MKRIINSMLGLIDLEVRKKKKPVANAHYNQHMANGLQRFKALNLPIKTVIDVGAAAGTWSISAREFWPDASFLLFEPLTERKLELETLVNKYSNFHFIPFAAGKGKDTIQFIISDDLDGSGVASSMYPDSTTRTVEVTSLPIQAERLNTKGPYLIKLDTHGFEIPILEGCTSILDQVSLFIIECYGFKIADNSLLFSEMCLYMDGLGFRLFDLVDVMNRPKDGAFWQCDAFFIKKDHTLFSHNKYA